jgi:HNH endonuclease
MCTQQGRSYCSEMGADASLWSKEALLEKPRWITDSFQTFQEVIQLTSEKKIDEARELLASAPDLEMREWFHVHAQNVGTWRKKAFGRPAPAPVMPLDAVSDVTKFESKLFARDNFKCLYCSCEVRPRTVFEKVQSDLGTEAFPLGKTNMSKSGFYVMFRATLDHVLPHSLGGRTEETNLVTSCWSCNFGKANFTVEQLGISDPRTR